MLPLRPGTPRRPPRPGRESTRGGHWDRIATCKAVPALGAMPRFYFDIRNPRLTIKDDERMELPDLDTACKEATVAAAEMIKDQVPCDYAEIALGTRGTGLRGHFGGAGDKAVGPRALSLGRPFTRG